MKVVPMGVGEAFDERYPNNSHLVFTDQAVILLDCGATPVRNLWKYFDHNEVDIAWISHQHSDHTMGLPDFLGRAFEDKRVKPLTVVVPEFLVHHIKNICQYVYDGLEETRWGFELNLVTVEEGETKEINGLELSFAPTAHSKPNLAIRVSDGSTVMCYSGDGQILPATEKLYNGAKLLIQETYLYDTPKAGHASMVDAIAAAERCDIEQLWLTHINRHCRRNELPGLMSKLKSDAVDIRVPEPLDGRRL